ncbi:MAG TPA: 4'-phosphopantetheinyl transferase superfamily protein [Puia sp.]|nr:4'-phosphopantetheinyl transferase superfamily protein [Puia sp.]
MPLVHCQHLGTVSWETRPAKIQAAHRTADLWRIPVPATPHDFDRSLFMLEPEENKRAERFHRDADRLRFITGRISLKWLAGQYLDCPSTDIQIRKGKNSKPFLQHRSNRKIYHNIAHSGDYVLIALADSELGVDLEKMEDSFNYEEVLSMSFSPAELAFIQKAENQRSCFYRLWTIKEALAKATSRGLDDGLQSLPSLDGDHLVEAAVIGSLDSWHINSFSFETYMSAIAYHPRIHKIRFWYLDEIPTA